MRKSVTTDNFQVSIHRFRARPISWRSLTDVMDWTDVSAKMFNVHAKRSTELFVKANYPGSPRAARRSARPVSFANSPVYGGETPALQRARASAVRSGHHLTTPGTGRASDERISMRQTAGPEIAVTHAVLTFARSQPKSSLFAGSHSCHRHITSLRYAKLPGNTELSRTVNLSQDTSNISRETF